LEQNLYLLEFVPKQHCHRFAYFLPPIYKSHFANDKLLACKSSSLCAYITRISRRQPSICI
jgi:hypothetical protein